MLPKELGLMSFLKCCGLFIPHTELSLEKLIYLWPVELKLSSVEVKLFSSRHLHFNVIFNNELRRCEINFLEERMDDLQVKLATYQRKNDSLLRS